MQVRVCLVTTEFHGLFKNGGIGTANTSLGLALAAAGLDVTVAFADSDENGPRVKEGNFTELAASYRELGIALDFVPAGRLVPKAFEDCRSASYCVYLYLKQHRFDVVYFNDCGGHGYYSLLAKRTGALKNAPRMYVVTHGPHEWVLELNSLRYWDRQPVIVAYMERRCAELADALISPSQYLVDWMTSHGWVMPAKVLVLQNLVRLPGSVAASEPSLKSAPIDEIVFFGRLEVRKGLELFCDAIDLLDRSAGLSGVRITFLGKFAQIGGLHSGVYAVERARLWPSPLRFLAKYGQEEALNYLNRQEALAVIPSLAENSPCVVAECLELGLPFVATDTGGTAELISADDRHLCLVAPRPQALAAKLQQILTSGQQSVHRAISQADTLSRWLELTESGVAGDAAEPHHEPAQVADALVSVCLILSSLSQTAALLIESLLRQAHPKLEFILVDDAVSSARRTAALAAFASASPPVALHVIAGPADRAGARLAAAAQATGEYLLFVEEDAAILMPECVETFVTAARRTGAGVVTGVPLQYQHSGSPAEGRDGWLSYFPIGACAELGAFENCFGNGVFLVDRRTFKQFGGFQTSHGPAIDDWAFLAVSVLSGIRLEVVPEPVFWYRMTRPVELNRLTQVDGYRRILDAYGERQIRIVRHMIETFTKGDQANESRLPDVLAAMSSEAREIALRASSHEPNSWQAIRSLVQFCVERHRLEDAFDFARHNGISFMADVIESAKLVAENLALDEVRGQSQEFWHEFVITGDVRLRIKPLAAPLEGLISPPGGIARYPAGAGVTVLKAHAVCPPRATSVRAVASVAALEPRLISLAVVVSTLNARMHLSGETIVADDAFWWSGWAPADERGARQELIVPVSEPSENALDLYFLSRTASGGAEPQGRIIWDFAAATIPVIGTISLPATETARQGTPISSHILERGVLLSRNSDFPFPVFVPGHPTLLHPLPGRVSLVRVAGAIPAGTKALRSVVSLEREESHPVQFAVWIRKSTSPASAETDFTEADAFSGWFSVEQTLRRHTFTVSIGDRATEAMDLYLATRVVEYPDVHFCHAVWHELLLLE